MSNDTTVPFLNPAFRDEMTDLIRAHAQTAIRQAVLAELEAFLGQHGDTEYPGPPERALQALQNNNNNNKTGQPRSKLD